MTADDQAAPAAPVARGPRIEPLTRLATGGMADIWLARELGAAGLERFVVVKRLLPHLAREPEIVDMFVSEARFVARLVHPNVVQIHELGEDEEGYFLVMEYVAGCSVRELMVSANRANQVLHPDVAIAVVEQACRGAHAAHELTDPAGLPLGLVHRDISPHNLMVGPSGDVKLLDFGIAKATEAAGGTHTGSLKGKCSYMSPEQCRAFRLDRRSDVFSLGIVLWELLVGKRLFQREAEFASMEAIVTGDYELPTAVRPELPAALDAVIAKALATKVAERYQTADDMRLALIAAAEASGLRPSRDALAATLKALLGERLDQRERALRTAATSPPDPGALRDVLMPSDPSLHPSSRSGATGRTGSDDIVTVVQRSSYPAPGPSPPKEAEAVTVTGLDDPDGPTEVSSPPPAMTPGDTVTSAPAAAPRNKMLATLMVLGALAVAIVVVVLSLRSKEDPETTAASSASPSSSVAGAAESAVVLSGPPLRFVVAPTVEKEVMSSELAPFTRWLGITLDRPVELVIAKSYQDTADMVTSGRAELGLFPPLLFVQTFASAPDIRPLALRLYDGARASDGYLLVRGDAPIKDAKNLRGRTICFVDRESTTGFLLPRIWLRAQSLDPDVDVKTRLSGDHLAALRELSEGQCDAAAVYSGAYLSAQKQGIAVGTMRVFAITGRVPQDVIAAAPGVGADSAAGIAAALTGFSPERDINAPRVGSVLRISGFAAFEASDFDLIRDAAAKEGLIPQADAGP